MADNEDELVDYDEEEEVAAGDKSAGEAKETKK
eukprot:CAMPEP_0113518174 /NCGR_PEP_ID=MMETSP0014_2-20120614/42713_1 /TAXON_ID=2857 /ORGANISM="Nitzschia sp." /LENGTH=32 /DNA_ID=CAMNT_0000415543 /DNA_START=100 /DNA_END=198 /DNA_ORIENTATION=- /assembly_acc=CAM_ASM_000159